MLVCTERNHITPTWSTIQCHESLEAFRPNLSQINTVPRPVGPIKPISGALHSEKISLQSQPQTQVATHVQTAQTVSIVCAEAQMQTQTQTQTQAQAQAQARSLQQSRQQPQQQPQTQTQTQQHHANWCVSTNAPWSAVRCANADKLQAQLYKSCYYRLRSNLRKCNGSIGTIVPRIRRRDFRFHLVTRADGSVVDKDAIHADQYCCPTTTDKSELERTDEEFENSSPRAPVGSEPLALFVPPLPPSFSSKKSTTQSETVSSHNNGSEHLTQFPLLSATTTTTTTLNNNNTNGNNNIVVAPKLVIAAPCLNDGDRHALMRPHGNFVGSLEELKKRRAAELKIWDSFVEDLFRMDCVEPLARGTYGHPYLMRRSILHHLQSPTPSSSSFLPAAPPLPSSHASTTMRSALLPTPPASSPSSVGGLPLSAYQQYQHYYVVKFIFYDDRHGPPRCNNHAKKNASIDNSSSNNSNNSAMVSAQGADGNNKRKRFTPSDMNIADAVGANIAACNIGDAAKKQKTREVIVIDENESSRGDNDNDGGNENGKRDNAVDHSGVPNDDRITATATAAAPAASILPRPLLGAPSKLLPTSSAPTFETAAAVMAVDDDDERPENADILINSLLSADVRTGALPFVTLPIASFVCSEARIRDVMIKYDSDLRKKREQLAHARQQIASLQTALMARAPTLRRTRPSDVVAQDRCQYDGGRKTQQLTKEGNTSVSAFASAAAAASVATTAASTTAVIADAVAVDVAQFLNQEALAHFAPVPPAITNAASAVHACTSSSAPPPPSCSSSSGSLTSIPISPLESLSFDQKQLNEADQTCRKLESQYRNAEQEWLQHFWDHLGRKRTHQASNPKGGVLVYVAEYASLGSLSSYALGHRCDTEVWRSLLAQCFYALAFFQARWPQFRHNDLHPGNVLLERVPQSSYAFALTRQHDLVIENHGIEVRLWDFDYACIEGVRGNRKVQRSSKFGITSRAHRYYDMHTLCNTLLSDFDLPALVRIFLREVVPEKYRYPRARFFRLQASDSEVHATPLGVLAHHPFFERYRRNRRKQ